MREPLTIAVGQPLCVPCDVAANALAHAATVRAAGARVVVFPEMSLTGYEFDAPPIAIEDPRLEPIVEACAETGSVALVGAPVHGEVGGSHIAMLAIDKTGVTVAYQKMWLGGAEPERFAPGSEPAVLEVDGWRLGLAICKDTGIPQHASDTAALGIDAYVRRRPGVGGRCCHRGRTRSSRRSRPPRLGRDRQLRRVDGRRLRPGGRRLGHLVA